MRIRADKGSEEVEGKAAAKKKMQRGMGEVKRIAKAEKIQEKIIAKRRVNTNRAQAKGDPESLEKARTEEKEALAILKKIQEDKKRAEAELKKAVAETKGETAPVIQEEAPFEAIARSDVVGREGVAPVKLDNNGWIPTNGLEEGVDYSEIYPVHEPYAFVLIEATQPPKYKILEVPLTKGEVQLLSEIKTYLYETLDIGFDGSMNPGEVIKKKVEDVVKEFDLEGLVSYKSMDKVMYYLRRDFIGYGRLDPIIHDSMAEDISADGPEIPLYIYHRNYGSIESDLIFSEAELDALIYRLSQRAGRHISLAKPLLDASLPTKDRLQLSIGSEITTRGSTFTIRKFKEIPFTPLDLVNHGTYSTEMMAYLWMAVDNGANVLIAGGTASGKTTALNAIATFIPPESKIISIEDTREINLLHQNWIPAVTREVEEGGHSIEMFDLLRTALRQRPEYVLVGEVRGKEAHTLFQAMATGHITLSTIHAESAETVVKRLTKHPINVPLMLLDGLDVIPIQRMIKLGDRTVRRCTKIIEVTGLDFENEALKTNELFIWRPKDVFEFSGESKVFFKIMDKLSLTETELSDEFMRRNRCLEELRARGMADFRALNNFLHEYNKDPENAEKLLLENALETETDE